MTKKCVLIISFLFSALVVSCSQSEQVEIVEQEQKSLDVKESKLSNEAHTNKSKIVTVRATKEELKEKPPLSKPQGERSVFFNGEKYLFTGGKLQKGSQVRNINMSESATIKGTLVVVVKASEIVDISLKHKVEIAKDTYRLTPNETDDLMTIYHELLAHKSIFSVELELLYGAKNSAVIAY